MENKQNLIHCYILEYFNIEENIIEIIKFLTENKTEIYIDENKINSLFSKLPNLSKSPISDFNKIIKDSYSEYFSFISTIDKQSIPDTLLYKHYNYDFAILKQLLDKHTIDYLQSYKEYNNKIIINLVSYLSQKQDKILDAGITKILNRSLCARSYENFKSYWIDMSFIMFLSKTYSLILGSNIARLFNFNIQEQSIFNIIFAYYFVSKCIDADNKELIKIVSNFNYLGTTENNLHVLNNIDEILQGKIFIYLEDLIKVIGELSPKKANLKPNIFLNINRNYSYDNLVSLVAIQYPGYWLHILYSTVSGERNNTFFIAKRINLLKDIILYMSKLNHNQKFIDSFEPI
jgi:hypothetical protein